MVGTGYARTTCRSPALNQWGPAPPPKGPQPCWRGWPSSQTRERVKPLPAPSKVGPQPSGCWDHSRGQRGWSAWQAPGNSLNRRGERWTLTFSSTPAGTTIGRNDSEWGQMGVIMMAGTLGWIMEAPAAAAYAVLPVGVETITPGGQAAGSLSVVLFPPPTAVGPQVATYHHPALW